MRNKYLLWFKHKHRFSVQQPIFTAQRVSNNQFYISTKKTIDIILYNKYKEDVLKIRYLK